MGNEITLDECVSRILADPGYGRWLALIVPAGGTGAWTKRTEDTLVASGVVPVVRLHPANGAELVRWCSDLAGLLIVGDAEHLSVDDWRIFDLGRSRRFQARESPVVLVLSEKDFKRLEANAPNIYSFLNGSVFVLTDEPIMLSDAERTQRLGALQEWAGISDAEVVQRHRDDALPALPEYAEWLLLLRMGEPK